MIIAFACGFIVASCIAFLTYKRTMHDMRVANAMLRNDSDYYYTLQEIMFKDLHHRDQELFNLDPEVRRIKHQYEENKKAIMKNGKY